MPIIPPSAKLRFNISRAVSSRRDEVQNDTATFHLAGGSIAGIVIGCLALLFFLDCWRRRRRFKAKERAQIANRAKVLGSSRVNPDGYHAGNHHRATYTPKRMMPQESHTRTAPISADPPTQQTSFKVNAVEHDYAGTSRQHELYAQGVFARMREENEKADLEKWQAQKQLEVEVNDRKIAEAPRQQQQQQQQQQHKTEHIRQIKHPKHPKHPRHPRRIQQAQPSSTRPRRSSYQGTFRVHNVAKADYAERSRLEEAEGRWVLEQVKLDDERKEAQAARARSSTMR